MTIVANGNNGEIIYSIVTDGAKCSVTKFENGMTETLVGKCSIKTNNEPVNKTKIVETTEKYDKDGNLVEKITREETSEDDGKGVWRAASPWATESINIPCPDTIPCCGRRTEAINVTY